MINYKLAKELKEDASYFTKHQYLTRHYGSPSHCLLCQTGGHKESDGRWSIHWAKRSMSDYTHDIRDYVGLCRSCHGRYDLTEAKLEHLRKMAKSQKGSTSEAKSLVAKNRQRDEFGHFIKATA